MKNIKLGSFVKIGAAALAAAAVVGAGLYLYGINSAPGAISAKSIAAFAEGPKSDEAKAEILGIIIRDTGTERLYGTADAASLTTLRGNFRGGESSDVIFAVNFGAKRAIAVLYAQTGGGYEFKCVVDTFMEIRDCQVLGLDAEHKDLLLVRERADQMLGAFEDDGFIRGYYYNGGQFSLVLNILEHQEAYYNELWESDSTAAKRSWFRFEDDASVKTDENLRITVKREQRFLTSKVKDAVEIPKLSDFSVTKKRTVTEELTWSSQFHRFILREGKIGEEAVAIIEDFANSAYNLSEDAKFRDDHYRIAVRSGETSIVERKDVKTAK